MRRILVGLDDSEYGAAALRLGIEWARQYNLLLVGLGIVDSANLSKPEPVPMGGSAFKVQRDADAVKSARRSVDELLEQFSLLCAKEGIASKPLEDEGSPVEQIVLEAQRVDLILLGQRTNFDLEGIALADEALPAVLKRCPRPVVAVPKTVATGKSVLVAYDGSDQSARALHMLVALGLAIGKPVHVVTVAADKVEAARVADRAAEYLQSHDISAKPHAVAGRNPAMIILEHVGSLDAGLLVLGAFGRRTVAEFFFGSVTRTILNQSPIPTLLYA